MKNFKTIDWLAFSLLIIGGLNWGLFGVFGLDLVAIIFGPLSLMSRIIYSLVGVSAVYLLANAQGIIRKS